MSYDMFRCVQLKHTIKVVCDSCYDRKYVFSHCPICGGKGMHKKTIPKWVVREIEIDKIDRDYDGKLRYWTSKSDYYREDDKLIHFTKQDAEDECFNKNDPLATVRNTDIPDRLVNRYEQVKVFDTVKTNIDELICDLKFSHAKPSEQQQEDELDALRYAVSNLKSSYDGLKVKYDVRKIEDGSLVPNCFVLRPDKDPAALEALMTYAGTTQNFRLSCDLYKWIQHIIQEESDGK